MSKMKKTPTKKQQMSKTNMVDLNYSIGCSAFLRSINTVVHHRINFPLNYEQSSEQNLVSLQPKMTLWKFAKSAAEV